MQPDLLVTSSNPSDRRLDSHGEWRPLRYTNWLLGTLVSRVIGSILIIFCSSSHPPLLIRADQRYGNRERPYQIHMAKSLSLPILSEISMMSHANASSEHPFLSIREALLRTSHHLFRGQFTSKTDQDDAYLMFFCAQ